MKKHNHKNNASETGVATKTCFVCRTTAPRNQMLRFVVNVEQNVVFDDQEVLPGRGMWLHANSECLQKAINKNLFCKAAKGTVELPNDLMDKVKEQLTSYPQKLDLFNQGGIHE